MPAWRTRRLFRTTDGGQNVGGASGLRSAKGHLWQPGAGGMGLHTILSGPEPSRADIHRHLGGGRVPD